MKNISILRIFTLIVTGIFITNFNTKSQKMRASNYSAINKNKFIFPGKEIATAQKDGNSSFQKFVKEAYAKLDENKIAILNMIPDSNVAKENSNGINQTEIESFKTDNNTLRIKLDNYVQNGSGNWESFRSEFYYGLDELEIACCKAPGKSS